MVEHVAAAEHFRNGVGHSGFTVVGNVGAPGIAGVVPDGAVDEADVAVFVMVGFGAGDFIAAVEGQTAVRAVVFGHAGDKSIGQVALSDRRGSLQDVVIGVGADNVGGGLDAVQGAGLSSLQYKDEHFVFRTE